MQVLQCLYSVNVTVCKTKCIDILQENIKKIDQIQGKIVEHQFFFLVLFFQGAPQLTENYLDSKKVKGEVFVSNNCQ